MRKSIQTIEDYEFFLYSLSEKFPSIKRSTVTLVRRGATLARVTGELYFDKGYRLVVRERLLYHRSPVVIDWYGYEILEGDEKYCRYDSQPHPNDPTLESTFPHHKHIPPNINRNRIPAPGMSFNRPNLPELIREVEALIEKMGKDVQ
ncbi:MAG: hypothetical protein GY950_07475 [bacterium]|nr:hypothetical protein [bacterium]